MITPIKINAIDAILYIETFSFKKKIPIITEKTILVSLKAATKGIGALVKHQTTIA